MGKTHLPPCCDPQNSASKGRELTLWIEARLCSLGYPLWGSHGTTAKTGVLVVVRDTAGSRELEEVTVRWYLYLCNSLWYAAQDMDSRCIIHAAGVFIQLITDNRKDHERGGIPEIILR